MISAAVLGLLAGCSGGDDDADAGPPQRSASETTTSTTAAPAEIDLSQPIPGGSLHGTPRPPLENTGDDYVAIFESLVANLRWLTENPDPAVVSDIYVPGTDDHDAGVQNFQYLVDQQWRAADDGYYLISSEILDRRPELLSLRVADSMEFERIVAADGTQVGEGRPRSPTVKEWTVLLARDAAGAWRIADWAPADAPTVQV